MPRFVLLRHECPPHLAKPSHWDLMLEQGDLLRTWDLRSLPTTWADALGEFSDSTAVAAQMLPDHRLDYLTYEGPVSGDRGIVRCCDRGIYQIVREDEKSLSVSLQGALLQGTVRLQRDGEAWLLVEC